jgi:hypothetical protein
MSKTSTLVSLLVLFCFLGGVHCMQWQAASNISAANHTFIWSTIQSSLAYVQNSGPNTNLSAFAKNISDTLNSAWDPAWNVFAFQLVGDSTLDAVVVGYAFRDHWMWFNGYTYQTRTFSFIIWKDYNCVTWISADNTVVQGSIGFSQFDAMFQGFLNNFTPVAPYDDIWTLGESIIT